MFRKMVAVTVVAVGLAFGSEVQANGHKGQQHGNGGNHHGHVGHHAQKFSHGHFYKGNSHRHWSKSYFNSRYHTTFYFDTGFGTWYYWSARREAFYPISYIETEPPTTDLGPIESEMP